MLLLEYSRMSKKRGNNSTPVSGQMKSARVKKEKDVFFCPVCDEAIIYAADGGLGNDSIHCDGVCYTWLHCRCAGLSKSAFITVSKSDEPFKCSQCKMQTLECELKSLKDLVNNFVQSFNPCL